MSELTRADRIWNRACGKDEMRFLPGDRALADMIPAHGLVMNGGVLHAVECVSDSELSAAVSAYRFFGHDAAANLLLRAKIILDKGVNLDFHEQELDKQYAAIIPDDSFLVERFQEHLEENPSEYAPLRAKDM